MKKIITAILVVVVTGLGLTGIKTNYHVARKPTPPPVVYNADL